MGNPFDQFDVAPAGQAPPAGGNPFDQFDAAAQPDQGALSASVDSMGNTLSFGLMDEAVAGGAATVDSIANMFRDNPQGDWSQNYARHLANQRA